MPVHLRLSYQVRSGLLLALICFSFGISQAQHSVARQWNEVLLESIRNDFARPTIHARNLFHVSTVMYDAWAAYGTKRGSFFLGDTLGAFICPFTGVPAPSNKKAAQEEAMSYAAYCLMKYRFRNSPGANYLNNLMDSVFRNMGYNPLFVSTQYATDGRCARQLPCLADDHLRFAGWLK
ncbi:MAG: hypothetical protein R3B47_12640 [Bacteroidia bacterium]